MPEPRPEMAMKIKSQNKLGAMAVSANPVTDKNRPAEKNQTLGLRSDIIPKIG